MFVLLLIIIILNYESTLSFIVKVPFVESLLNEMLSRKNKITKIQKLTWFSNYICSSKVTWNGPNIRLVWSLFWAYEK